MSQSGYNISDLVREAQTRWLKPPEVYFILQNYDDHMITHEPVQRPASGSLFLFNRRVFRNFRRDGHMWRRKKDGRSGEAHEKLKAGNVEALNCYYAHGEQNPLFQRRSYWMLDPEFEHIVLVHYRDVDEVSGRNNVGSVSQFSLVSSSTFNQSPSSYASLQAGSSAAVTASFERFQNSSSPESLEISSDPVPNTTNQINTFGNVEASGELSRSSGPETSEALQRLEKLLSLDDDSLKVFDPFYTANADADDLHNIISSQAVSSPVLGHEVNDWNEMLDDFDSFCDMPQVRHVQKYNENGIFLTSLRQDPSAEQDNYTNWINFGGSENQESSAQATKEVENFKYQPSQPTISMYDNSENFMPLFDQRELGISLEDAFRLTMSHKQKFTIRELSPEWGYASEATKILIEGSFLCDPSESAWTCMFGDVEVPAQIIREGVISCHAPPHLPGKVTICITSGNRESCSEIREFEYRDKPSGCRHCGHPETETRTSEEMLLLVKFVQLLLSTSMKKREGSDSDNDLLGKSRAYEDSWVEVIEGLLVGDSTSATTTDWLLQELMKDKLQNWLSSRSPEESDQQGCGLSKKEQGVIHMVAGLGFEWALYPILKSGVGVNFRDVNGWTALHWAARFGRERMVAELIASGASAGAVTKPNPHDPTGKTAASIAATWGHRGLAGYLSEVALTSHLSSLTLEESELSKGSANVEAERTLNSVLPQTVPVSSEDQLSLKDTLAAVRNAAQAAARIQSAFRAHSFRRRQLKEAALNLDEYGMSCSDIQGFSSAFRNSSSRDYNSAALSIQKKYRGWKGRKDFLMLRQKVVKIQSHVRGSQVRKKYRVVWAVGVLEKVVLRWRRRGAGLRGFRHENGSIDEIDDENIRRVFRKQKVDMALDEAVSRVLSMVEVPEARLQYRRILEKYRQAKAEHDEVERRSDAAASSSEDVCSMENDDIYLVT